jgi:hypothetical protein
MHLCPHSSRNVISSVAALTLLAFALAAPPRAAAQALTTASINDASFNNMKAVTMTIPAGWKMQGLIATNPCDNNTAWPAFRAYSSDGLTEMRTMPVFGWRWRPNLRNLDKTGCLPINGPIPAADFLKLYVETLQGGVHIIGPMNVSEQYRQWAENYAARLNSNQANMAPAIRGNHTADVAALHIETPNGSFVIDQRLRVAVECAINNNPGPMQGGTCWARLEALRAPKGKLDALVELVDRNNLPHGQPEPDWQAAVLQRQQQEGQRMLAQLTAQEQASANMLRQQHEQIMATMQHNHEAFMAQQESQFQSSMKNANDAMNARTTAASDWVDYALDQQTVSGAGGTVKVSSAYSQTWSNGQGQWYQTNDPNADPNGALYGNWTRDTKVHGNGQSY